MGRISKSIELVGLFQEKKLEAMFDTGAGHNFLPQNFKDGSSVEDIGYKEFLGTHDFMLADNTNTKGSIVKFDQVIIEGLRIKEPYFVILDNLLEDVIIGTQLMQDNLAVIRLGEDIINFR